MSYLCDAWADHYVQGSLSPSLALWHLAQPVSLFQSLSNISLFSFIENCLNLILPGKLKVWVGTLLGKITDYCTQYWCQKLWCPNPNPVLSLRCLNVFGFLDSWSDKNKELKSAALASRNLEFHILQIKQIIKRYRRKFMKKEMNNLELWSGINHHQPSQCWWY